MEGIERIVKEAQRLKHLVLELLDVARIEQGKLVTRREPVKYTTTIREACARHAGARHHFLLAKIQQITTALDEQRIVQLIDNLLENAIKYTPDGGDIQVALWREQDTAHIAVTDPGIGIPPADLPQLFDRFS